VLSAANQAVWFQTDLGGHFALLAMQYSQPEEHGMACDRRQSEGNALWMADGALVEEALAGEKRPEQAAAELAQREPGAAGELQLLTLSCASMQWF
jgi:hypothetical protein